MKLRNLYVLVHNTDRAIDFYTSVLPFILYHKEERYTILKIDDVYFGLLNEQYEKTVLRGNNCIPVLKVENIQDWYKKLQKFNVRFVTKIHDLPTKVRYFQFYDTEGNILEIYQEL